jgi:predicted nucleic acid-binding protein
MTETLVVDASVAVKWVVQEEGTEAALRLRFNDLVAPELILAECANILWKKAERAELTREAALLSARLLERSGIEFVSLYGLSERTVALAIELGHPAYDCAYLALALARRCRMVTADRRLLARVDQRGSPQLAALCTGLGDFAT